LKQSIPILIYVLIVSLIALIILSFVYKKLKEKTVLKLEYVIGAVTTIGILLFFLPQS